MNQEQKIFIEVSVGIELDNGTVEKGVERRVTPEQLLEYQEVLGLKEVVGILSLYYRAKSGDHECICDLSSPTTSRRA